MATVSMVIGSWGSYNACNERALGSKWLDLSNYSSWEDIEEELEEEGFELDGIDEELFIQDIEGIDCSGIRWDYEHPKTLFELLKESGVLDNSYLFEVMEAYIEVESWKSFRDLVEQNGERWSMDINIYRGFDWEDYGKEMFALCCYEIPDHIMDFIDFERYGEYVGEYAHEYSNGIIEILG